MSYKNTILQRYTGNWNSYKRTNGGKGFRYWAEVESKAGRKYWVEVNISLRCDPYYLNYLHKEGDWAVIDTSKKSWEIVDMKLNRN